jgi:hypothetical protein
MNAFTKDLIVLVADNDAQLTVDELLKRHEALGVRPIQYDLIRHPQRDSGCRGKPQDLLRGYLNTHRYAMVIYDHHGSGRDQEPVEVVESETMELIERTGWSGRAAVIVISPELEIWMWSDSSEVDQVLGWTGRHPALRDWIQEQGLTDKPGLKPSDPKEAYHRSLREVRRAVSASHFKEMAKSVSFRRCVDPSFTQFVAVLKGWF